MHPILVLHFVWHIAGAAVFIFLVFRMRAWPREAEKYSRRTRWLLLLPLSRDWEDGVQAVDLPTLRAFRRSIAMAILAGIAFAYAELGYYIAASYESALLKPAESHLLGDHP